MGSVRRNRGRRAGVALGVLVALGIGMAPAARVRATESAETRQLKQKRRSIETKKKSIEEQKNITKQKVGEMMRKIEQLDGQLTNTQETLQDLEVRLVKMRSHHAFLERERDRKRQELDTLREAARRRLVAYYRTGPTKMVGLLMQSDTYADLMTRQRYVQALVENDRARMLKVQSLKADIDDKILEMDEQITKINALEEQHRRNKALLEQEQQEKKQVLGKLRVDLETFDRMIKELERTSNDIAAEIARQSRELSRGLTREGFRAPVTCPVTSQFGMRYHPILKRKRMHTGTDLGCAHGTPIRAASSGRVYWAAWKKGYGNTVILVHAGGLSTLYAHMSRIDVKAGQVVSGGQLLGLVGSTGLATGPHLHYEVHKDGKVVNPISYLR